MALTLWFGLVALSFLACAGQFNPFGTRPPAGRKSLRRSSYSAIKSFQSTRGMRSARVASGARPLRNLRKSEVRKEADACPLIECAMGSELAMTKGQKCPSCQPVRVVFLVCFVLFDRLPQCAKDVKCPSCSVGFEAMNVAGNCCPVCVPCKYVNCPRFLHCDAGMTPTPQPGKCCRACAPCEAKPCPPCPQGTRTGSLELDQCCPSCESCADVPCEVPQCSPGQTVVLLPGTCCPVCK
jgi:hypothetical protein